MRMVAFAVWAPGRRQDTEPRTEDDVDYMNIQWRPEGLLQWSIAQGWTQTAARAEDLAMLAALFGPPAPLSGRTAPPPSRASKT